MADDKKNDLQFYSNQPYDMEVKLNDNDDEKKKISNRILNRRTMRKRRKKTTRIIKR